jgi:hypothetical protein
MAQVKTGDCEGQFRIEDLIAHSGMASIFLATCCRLETIGRPGRTFAVLLYVAMHQ